MYVHVRICIIYIYEHRSTRAVVSRTDSSIARTLAGRAASPLYVCVCVCVCVCACVRAYVFPDAEMSRCANVYKHSPECTRCIHTKYRCTTCMYPYLHMYICVYTYTYVHAINTYTYVHAITINPS